LDIGYPVVLLVAAWAVINQYTPIYYGPFLKAS